MKKALVLALAPMALAFFGQSALAQSAIEKSFPATVTIEVASPDGQGHGSEFVVSSDGIIVTAAHVIEGVTSATVRFRDGMERNLASKVCSFASPRRTPQDEKTATSKRWG